uniref:NADH dehydrogenase [ubiquinone] 1 beta subcomplex subunit 10 n=1 Tax=Corethrella appendiculata TaxID=1370023 RepID=U5EWT9_9DIPT
MPEARNILERGIDSIYNLFEAPVVWFRESVVVPNQKQYPWYHQQFRRVPTMDECYTDDKVCMWEADQQFRRDRMVDNEIVNIMRQRFEDCVLYETPDHMKKCTPIFDAYNKAAENWFIKYGDLGGYYNAKKALMKQKHRLVWERRHGKVGTGMREPPYNTEAE